MKANREGSVLRNLISTSNGLGAQKLFALEFVRFVAAMGVLLWHYQHFFFTPDLNGENFQDYDSLPFYSYINILYNHGASGVQLFWAVSGFVLFHNYGYRKFSGREFLQNRFFRLYPLHFLTLIIVAILQLFSTLQIGHPQIYFDNSFSNFLLHLFFLSGWASEPALAFNQPIWSVSVEILIYILFCVSLLRVRKFRIRSALFIVVFFMIIIYSIFCDLNSILKCLLYFCLGVLIQILNLARFSYSLLLTSIGFLGTFAGDYVRVGPRTVNQFLNSFNPNLVLVLQVTCVLVMASRFDYKLRQHMDAKMESILSFLGNLTYSSYLVHIPLQIAFLIAINLAETNQMVVAQSKILFFSYFLVVIIVSRITFVYFENPIRRRYKFTKRLN